VVRRRRPDALRRRWVLARARPTDEPIRLPAFLHFGIHLPSPEAVHAFRDRLAAEGVRVAEEWDEPAYVSVKFLDPDGYVVEAAWEPDDR
jgi:catechol 2,3-dioxygenase-like lactoylglutathione lyase family enzyme